MKLTIYYNVQSGGDGSVGVYFFESEELALWDEEHDPYDEGWAESSVSNLSFESDSLITCTSRQEIKTKEAYLIDHYLVSGEHEKWQREFIEKFFPDGLPIFTVTTEEIHPDRPDYKYLNNNVFVDGVKVADQWQQREESGKVFEDFLNGRE